LDTSAWLVAKRQWGGVNANGGVVPENVKVQNGKLMLEAHGNLYAGPVKGINKDGTVRADGKKVGAAIATKDYYGSGKYEFSMKVAPELGVSSAVWTFHYQEVEPGDPQYQGSGDYYVVNHEIDIEIPGRTGPAHTNIGFNKALLNTWQGENEGEYTTGYTDLGKYVNDGQFHTYRFDWHTGGNGQTKRADFYLDGVFLRSITTDIPDIAGRLWLGAWFPNGWTGTPGFDTETFEIDWVKITPFDEPGDRFLPETYPNDGWADPVEEPPGDDDDDGANLIANGDFSTMGSWTNLAQPGASAVISNGRLNLTPTSAATAEVEQYVNVTPGNTYTLSAKMWNSGSNTWGYLRVYDNGFLTEAGYNSAASQTKSVTFTAASSQVRVVLHAYKQQTGTYYFDDVNLH